MRPANGPEPDCWPCFVYVSSAQNCSSFSAVTRFGCGVFWGMCAPTEIVGSWLLGVLESHPPLAGCQLLHTEPSPALPTIASTNAAKLCASAAVCAVLVCVPEYICCHRHRYYSEQVLWLTSVKDSVTLLLQIRRQFEIPELLVLQPSQMFLLFCLPFESDSMNSSYCTSMRM